MGLADDPPVTDARPRPLAFHDTDGAGNDIRACLLLLVHVRHLPGPLGDHAGSRIFLYLPESGIYFLLLVPYITHRVDIFIHEGVKSRCANGREPKVGQAMHVLFIQ